MSWLPIALWWWADFLIVPGVRVGPVDQKSTERALLALPGAGAKAAQIYMGEGFEEPGVVLYPDDPSRRLEVVWRGSPPAPAFVWICRGGKVPCRWRTAAGVSMGTTLKELERLNWKPFKMSGCCFDYAGSVVSFEDGKLASYDQGLRLFLNLRTDGLSREEIAPISGDRVISSSHPVLQKLNPRIGVMRLDFPERPRPAHQGARSRQERAFSQGTQSPACRTGELPWHAATSN